MISDRIKLARKKAGMSLRDLAAALDGRVSAQAIGKYERGEMTPSSGVLIALGKALDVSLSYLMDSQGIVLSGVEFRAKAKTSGREQAQVEAAVLEWVERYLQLETILELDSAEWKAPCPPQKLEKPDAAEDLAKCVRKEWILGEDPIPNVTELLEEKGLKVMIEDLPANVSGLTCLVAREGYAEPVPVIVVNRAYPVERRRLTLVHELGHRLIDETSPLSPKDEERASNRFAAAFLMPADHVRREVGLRRHSFGYKEVIELKRLYRVSAAAFVYRLKDLEIISEQYLGYVFQSVGRTWRSQEPEGLESNNLKEQPYRLERLCYRALSEDLISTAKAAELLRKPVNEIEADLKGPSRDVQDYRQ